MDLGTQGQYLVGDSLPVKGSLYTFNFKNLSLAVLFKLLPSTLSS